MGPVSRDMRIWTTGILDLPRVVGWVEQPHFYIMLGTVLN